LPPFGIRDCSINIIILGQMVVFDNYEVAIVGTIVLVQDS